MKKPDIISGAAGVATGTYILIEGAKMPSDFIMKIGPSFFPNVLAVGLIGFSAFLAVSGALSKQDGNFEKIDFKSFGIWRAIIALVIAAVYTLLLKPIGFIPDTLLFLSGLMLLLGSKKALDLVLAPVLGTIGIWFIFEKMLSISLPVGVMAVFGL